MSLSYIFLPISGAHFNPAISAACLVTRYFQDKTVAGFLNGCGRTLKKMDISKII
jgi:glycerol uptake facilitator-like aquaporin